MNVSPRTRSCLSAALWLGLAAGVASYAPLTSAATTAPTPVKTPAPDFPPKAMDAGTEGWVEVEFTVMPDGSVQDISVVGADPPHTFEVAAVRAVSQWTFKPGTRDGAAVATHVRQKIDFKP